MKTCLLLGTLAFALVAACSDADDNGSCGDGMKTGSEQCDDGNKSNGDGCSATCQMEGATTCGDGTVFVATEQCDDGNTVDGDGCSAKCKNECGNGMLDGAEGCDDGNVAADDGCSPACAVEAGYTCTGEPSDCIAPTGACTDPYVVDFMNNAGALVAMEMGDTTTSTDQIHEADCDGYPAGSGKDHVWSFTITDTRDVTVTINTTTPMDAVLRLLAIPCDGTSEIKEHVLEDGCSDSGLWDDGEQLSYTGLPAGTYFIVVDGWDDAEVGVYDFTVTATATLCGNGMLDGVEQCDDLNSAASDGCSPTCDQEAGYACTGEPSVCGSACGQGTLDAGEECDDDNTVPGDRCSDTCTLEYDIMESEPGNNTVAQMVSFPSNHRIRGALTAGDVDLYTFTLTSATTLELETYDTIDLEATYSGAGTNTLFDCVDADTEIRVFNSTGDPTMDDTALFYDDEDGDGSCSYTGPGDTDGPNPMEGVLLPAGTYVVKVNHYFSSGTATRYILDMKFSTTTTNPVPPVAGDLVLNEFMAADNMSDTNCDGVITGTNDEFVELVNVSNKTLDITGVTIADSVIVRHTFAAGPTGSMTLDPGKAVVVWTGGAPACPGVPNWFIASTDQLGLNDAGDTITVKDAQMNQLLQVIYPATPLNVSKNLSPELTGTAYVAHTAVAGAVGAWSPGKRADGSAF